MLSFNLSTRDLTALAVALALLMFSMGLGAPAARTKPTTHTVTIDASSFAPDVLTIKTGDSVVWVNKDFFPHTATSQAGGFDSGSIASGKSWKYTAAKKGEFAYICTFHPTTMKATLRVK